MEVATVASGSPRESRALLRAGCGNPLFSHCPMRQVLALFVNEKNWGVSQSQTKVNFEFRGKVL